MSGRVGRDRYQYRGEHMQQQQPHPSSSTPSSLLPPLSSSRSKNNPPSRHLWVGSLAQHVEESTLRHHLIRFGELESVAFHPGRSYAFVNYVRKEDAMAALDSLQGFVLAGMPLRVEFAKADKSSGLPRDGNYLERRDELHSSDKSYPFSKRESRIRHGSPDALLHDNLRSDNNTDHPSKILWIGFPAFLKVDDTILRKAFSPFGEIEKITAFQGRTYAFVQFRFLASACRAKETLQGRLFGNPRVHICFARSDTASFTGGRRGVQSNALPSPHAGDNCQAVPSDNFCSNRNFATGDPCIGPPYFSDVQYGDPDTISFSRKGGNSAYEGRRFHEFGPDVGLPEGPQGYCNSPRKDGSALFHEVSPQRSKRSLFSEDPWDLPEDGLNYREAKKLKFGSLPHERELHEYPFQNIEQAKHAFPRIVSDHPLSDETRYHQYRDLHEHPMNVTRTLGDGHDRRSSHDILQSAPPFASPPVDWKRTTSELHQPAVKGEWKWEGIIAKGGTSVCRARCFPVGKVMDMFLPELLDCTARTGLDMLAKHYDQAADSWVVFFVPASDGDMGYYNEFMHYLEEKQRAAVVKLDERNTLFLVPPSDFSEKVLKVPGKLSISGVILRLEPASPTVASHPPANETRVTNLMHSHKSETPSGSFHSLNSYTHPGKPGIDGPSFQGTISTSAPSIFPGYSHSSGSLSNHMENRHEFSSNYASSILGPPIWSSDPPQTTPLNVNARPSLQPNTGNFTSEHSSKSSLFEGRFPAFVPLPPGGVQSQHTQRQSATPSSSSSSVFTTEDFRASDMMMRNQPENVSKVSPSPSRYNTAAQAHQVPSQLSTPQFGPTSIQASSMTGNRGNQELVSTTGSAQDEGEGDPQKRLQATLQLAAALLQQIQQGKGT